MLAIAPINGNGGSLNDIFILELRSDYLIHALQFLPWMFFGMKINKSFLLWLIAGLFFASITEGIQYFLTYRSFNINDLIANLIGVLLGSITFLLKFINRNPEKEMFSRHERSEKRRGRRVKRVLERD